MTARLQRTAVAAAATFVLLTSLAAGAPAYAATYAANLDDGQQTGGGLSVIQTLLIFVGIPAALFAGIVVLVSAPSMARGPRYRPGLGWWAAPVWFNGPDDADSAVRTAEATTGGGGASARW
ncbi:MAG: hypothetical protein ABI807_10210 [Sporichthyaceae bacterium]